MKFSTHYFLEEQPHLIILFIYYYLPAGVYSLPNNPDAHQFAWNLAYIVFKRAHLFYVI